MDRRDLPALKAAVPLHAVISEYVPLRKAGREFRGSCPFCGDDSGQFSVNSDKGVYHCFECLAGGDVLTFITRMEHLSFGEAVDRLAAQGGISLRAGAGHHDRQHVERIRLVEAHQAAARFFATELNTSPEAELGRKFLAEHGFDQAAAARFGVGYSRQGWDHLARHLRGKGFTDKELLLSGLTQEGRRGPIDRFRGRLMWPIRNLGGEVVGFGARKLHEADNGPKYINTPETPIYKKTQALFGVDLAKKYIARANSALVVEGYADVMACHLAGITTVVSTCGTPFGSDHIAVLRRLLTSNGSARIVFAVDDDDIGHQTALRALHNDQKFAAESFITVVPSGPTGLRLAKGDSAVAELAEPRTPLFDFMLNRIIAGFDLSTAVGQRAALEKAAPVIARIRNYSLCDEVAIRLAGKLGDLGKDTVVRHVQRLARKDRDGKADGERRPSHTTDQGRPKPTISLRNPVHLTERELLKIALQRPHLVSPAFDSYGIDEFTAPPYAAVRRAIMEAGGCEYGVQAPDEYLSLVRQSAPDEAIRAMVTELATEPIMRKNVDGAYAGAQLVVVRRHSVERRTKELLSVLSRDGVQEDLSHFNAVQNELWTLQQYGLALRERGVEAL
ncbi:DNA primase [Streptomyces sp. NPDC032940]|uniref:DNA primase n=1 Tax=Streptomyces sp. NPDC032940 TaxID=3155366 RepID=UPI0033E324AA